MILMRMSPVELQVLMSFKACVQVLYSDTTALFHASIYFIVLILVTKSLDLFYEPRTIYLLFVTRAFGVARNYNSSHCWHYALVSQAVYRLSLLVYTTHLFCIMQWPFPHFSETDQVSDHSYVVAFTLE